MSRPSSDPVLDAYMRDLRRYPILDREREEELSRRYIQTRDPKVAQKLAEGHLRLVVKIAAEYSRHSADNRADLIQEGNLGLLRAIERYDPERGVRLSSYAAWWIRAYMLRVVVGSGRLVRVGSTAMQRRLIWAIIKEPLRDDIPVDEVIAERLNVSPREVARMRQHLAGDELSLHGQDTYQDVIPDGSPTPDEAAESGNFHGHLRARVEEFARQLPYRDRAVFRARFLSEEPETLGALGERHGITRERVRQIEARLRKAAQVYLACEMGDSVPQMEAVA